MTAIVFDIGNVLMRWDPVPVFEAELGSRDAVDEFLRRIDFDTRNQRADGGENFADLAAELADEADRERLGLYLSNFPASLVEPIEGTWMLMERLRAGGYPIHAITNWSAETWPSALVAHPRLGDAFETVIVSGAVRMLKPDPAIFRLFCERAGLAPGDCLFIDDKRENCEGAESIGMKAVHFTTPQALEDDLTRRGLL